MQTDGVSRLDFCSYCLSCDRGLYEYPLEKSPSLKSIFQVEELLFCYICTKIAKNTEEFIQKVGNAQKMFCVIDASTLSTIKQQLQPLRYLDSIHLGLIQISPEKAENCEDDNYKTYSYDGKMNEYDVKEEIKLENVLQSNDDDNELGDGDDLPDPTSDMKNELSLLMMKQELVADDVDLKVLKKRGKKESSRRKEKSKQKIIRKESVKKIVREKEVRIKKEPGPKLFREVPDTSYIETLPLPRAALARERAAQASAPQYRDSPLKCADCITGFTVKASYMQHMVKHSASHGQYECKVCKIRKTTERLLHIHMRLHQIRYRCKVCHVTRLHRKSIRTHYSDCHDTATVSKCPQCSKSYKSTYSLRKHVWNVHKRTARVVCDHCQKTYVNKLSLERHIPLQHPEVFPPLRTYPCEECTKTYITRAALSRHMLAHTDKKEFYCVECDKGFKTAQRLKCHLTTAAPHVKELRHACAHCEKRFATKRTAETHVNRVHLNRRPYRCDQCDRGYVLKSSLATHVRLRHEGYERPRIFPCPYCDKMFQLKTVLKSHIRTHTGERPYECKHCTASFAQSSAYHTHTKLVHLKLTRDGRPKMTR